MKIERKITACFTLSNKTETAAQEMTRTQQKKSKPQKKKMNHFFSKNYII